MKKGGIAAIILTMSVLIPSFAFATLSCSVKSSCDALSGEVEILAMSDALNGHAALSGSGYTNKVCCDGLPGLANTGGTAFLNLSAASNAHVGKITGDTVSASAARIASNGPMDCVYQASCPSQYICLASIEKDSNAHIGDCSAYPNNKVCCGCADSSEVTDPSFCSDGIDNDCDGLIDCADPECDGAIQGKVWDIANVPIEGAVIKALVGSAQRGSDISDGTGYHIPVPCGTYNLVVDHLDYARVTKQGVVVPPQTMVTYDFTGENAVAKADSCESDCTFPGSSIVHASCMGKNGCSFYDAQAAQACDDAQPGWKRDYGAAQYVICPNGNPQESAEQRAKITCESEICAIASTPVLYNGQQGKIVVVVSGK